MEHEIQNIVKLCEPIAKYLSENHSVHTYVMVTQSEVIIGTGISNFPISKSISKDELIDEIASALSDKIDSSLSVSVDI